MGVYGCYRSRGHLRYKKSKRQHTLQERTIPGLTSRKRTGDVIAEPRPGSVPFPYSQEDDKGMLC
jgi:hypothetical protein